MNRSAETAMFFKLREKLPELTALLASIQGDENYSVAEDLVYRYYHGSFKVYRVQGITKEIVDALQALAPDLPLNAEFMDIYRAGTGHTFEHSHNSDWSLRGRPMLEAFFHARFMLEMAVTHGNKLKDESEPPDWLDSGWAVFLYLYNLR